MNERPRHWTLEETLREACRLYGWIDPDTLALNPGCPWESAAPEYVQFWQDVQSILSALVAAREGTGTALPPLSFGEIAVDLYRVEGEQNFGLSALDLLAAKGRAAGAGEALTLEVTLTERAARTTGTLADLFRTLAPYETEVRAFLDRLERRRV